MKLCDAEETRRMNWLKINKIMGLGNFIRRGPLVVINEVDGTSRSGNPGAIAFRKQDTVTRKGSCFPGPIFSLGFYYWGMPEAATRPRDLRLKQRGPLLETAWNYYELDSGQLKPIGLCSEREVALCTEDKTGGHISGFGICLQRAFALTKVSEVAPNFLYWGNKGQKRGY